MVNIMDSFFDLLLLLTVMGSHVINMSSFLYCLLNISNEIYNLKT